MSAYEETFTPVEEIQGDVFFEEASQTSPTKKEKPKKAWKHPDLAALYFEPHEGKEITVQEGLSKGYIPSYSSELQEIVKALQGIMATRILTLREIEKVLKETATSKGYKRSVTVERLTGLGILVRLAYGKYGFSSSKARLYLAESIKPP